jgi:glycine/serine hydroxymethyltransferase
MIMQSTSSTAIKLIEAFQSEVKSDQSLLSLVANEGVMSLTARSVFNSSIIDRYFNGPGDTLTGGSYNTFTPFTSRGYPSAATLIEAGQNVIKRRLGAKYVTLSPLSGLNAMTLALIIASKPGELVATIPVANGGHFATELVLKQTGRRQIDLPMCEASTRIDLDALKHIIRIHGPKVVYLDSSFILEPHDIIGLRDTVGSEIIIIYDASQTIGLMIGGFFQSPLYEGADIVTANTHKTLHGPHKGLMAFRSASMGKCFNETISSGLLSSTHFSALVSLAITLLELDEYGFDLAESTIKNACELSREFCALGYNVRSTSLGTPTCNHQAHVFINTDEDYRKIYGRLYTSNIAVNFDNALGGHLYLRFGSQNISRKGMTVAEMKTVAMLIDRVIRGSIVRNEVQELVSQYSAIKFSFDEIYLPNGGIT